MNRHSGGPFGLLAAAAAAVLLALLPVAPASASSPTGWVRLAHLSPDTKRVDVTLSSLSGATMVLHLSKVGYGDVSPYMRLPVGTYAIAMVPTGAPAGSTPVVSASVAVTRGRAETVAAMNLNTDIETHVFRDDLTPPAGDSARVRVIQASTEHREVTVKDGSATVAASVTFAHASGYAQVPAGTASVSVVAAGSTNAERSVRLAGGSVHTLFVLDTAAGGLTVTPVLDSAGAAVMPTGAVDTGAGGLAGGAGSSSALAGELAALAALAAAAVGARFLRRPAGAPAKP